MVRRVVLVATFTALPALGACLLTTDLDSLSEPDATVLAPSSTSSSTSSTSSSSGTSGSTEAGVDAGGDGGLPTSDGGPFCAAFPDATFCSEIASPPAQGWGSVEVSSLGSAEAVSDGRSPPYLLRAAIAPGGQGAGNAYLDKAFPGRDVTYARHSFDMRVWSVGADRVETGGLIFTPAGTTTTYGYIPVVKRNRELVLLTQAYGGPGGSQENYGPTLATLPAAPQWSRITVEVEVSTTSPSRVSVWLDQSPLVTRQVVDLGLKPSSFIVAQGVYYQRRNGQDAETKLDFDNVLIEAR